MLRELVFMSILVLFGCRQKKTPTLPIQEDKLVVIMADVRIAEEMQKPFLTAERDSAMLVYMDSIYQIHNIDSAQFAKTLSIIEADVHRLQSLEVKVHSKLKELLDDVDL